MHHSQASMARIESDFENESEYLMKLKKMPVTCICPKCGVTHVLKFLRTGRGTPRKYCRRCRETVTAINDQCASESSPDIAIIGR